MLKRCGEKEHYTTDEVLVGDNDGAATWRRIVEAVAQLANKNCS